MSTPSVRQAFVSTRSVYICCCFVVYVVCMALFVAPFVKVHGMRAILAPATQVELGAAWGRRS